MTKQEMILEMLSVINWSDKTKAEHLKRVMKNDKRNIRKVYNYFLTTDRTSKNGWFCICGCL